MASRRARALLASSLWLSCALSPTPSPASVTIDFVPPAPGSVDAVVGRVNGLGAASLNASSFKLVMFISNDTATWYRKDQNQYTFLQPQAAQAGVVLNGDGSFRIFPWASNDQLLHDGLKSSFAFLMVPQAFDLLAADRLVSGAPIPQFFLDAAYAMTTINRYTNAVTRDLPGQLGRSSTTPVATPSPTPSWTMPSVAYECICAPRLSIGGGSISGPIQFIGVSRRAGANAVAVGTALTYGLGLAGPADPSCPRPMANWSDVQVVRASIRIVAGYNGPGEGRRGNMWPRLSEGCLLWALRVAAVGATASTHTVPF